MALTDKIRIQYRCSKKHWLKIKWLQNVDKIKDTHKLMDILIRKGIKVYENEREKK